MIVEVIGVHGDVARAGLSRPNAAFAIILMLTSQFFHKLFLIGTGPRPRFLGTAETGTRSLIASADCYLNLRFGGIRTPRDRTIPLG